MFSNCNTLKELNIARVQKCSDGVPIVEVNNAYNARKKEIMAGNVHYTKVPYVKLPVNPSADYLATLLYKGPSSDKGVIKITPEGVYA